jgi:hypothetical protein
MPADPVQIPFVLLVLWIRDRFEELCIAAGASNILRWAAVRSTAAVDQRRRDVSIGDLLLDDDDVMPVITEVVDVVKAAGIESDLVRPYRARRRPRCSTPLVRRAHGGLQALLRCMWRPRPRIADAPPR